MTFVLIIGGIDLTVGSVVGASGVAVVMLMEAGYSYAAYSLHQMLSVRRSRWL